MAKFYTGNLPFQVFGFGIVNGFGYYFAENWVGVSNFEYDYNQYILYQMRPISNLESHIVPRARICFDYNS